MTTIREIVEGYIREQFPQLENKEDAQKIIRTKLEQDIKEEVLYNEKKNWEEKIKKEVRINKQIQEWKLFICLTIIVSFLIGITVNETFEVLEAQNKLGTGEILLLSLGSIILIVLFLFTDIRDIFKGEK